METPESAAALDTIDVEIAAHVKGCPTGGDPEECDECDALWTRRSEAHA